MQEAANATVKQSASGIIEVVKFGNIEFAELNIPYATDIIDQGYMVDDASGVSKLRYLMNYLITKAPIEMVQDVNNPSVFTKCILESTRANKKGVGYTLKELYSRGLTGYFETGKLKFRKID